jgi:AcrR family transcriptional regulator
MTFMAESDLDWRERKKNATRERIREAALRLFRAPGYDATTVGQIAGAAGVSHMTFFRYFPAKEDVALSDSCDPLIASAVAETPAAWPVTRRIRTVTRWPGSRPGSLWRPAWPRPARPSSPGLRTTGPLSCPN